MEFYDVITTVSIIMAYILFGRACSFIGYKKGKEHGEREGYRKGMSLVCDEVRKIINKPKNNSECGTQNEESPPVAIGDEVYAVLCPFDENDPPAYIEPYRVYGVGVAKDGKSFIINEDLEHFMLDDEDEGLSFSTREKAEQYLKGLEKNGM